MNAALVGLGLAVAAYFAIVVALGVAASRSSSRSPEEYFLAGRGLGTVVLFMALFGTNTSSFVLVGIPAQSYLHGVGVFGLNAAVVALGIPLSFWAIGSPARRMAQRLGALTPAELFARRFRSRALGVALFVAFTAYTLPYMVQGVKGAAVTLAAAAGGAIAADWAGLLVLAVALVYTGLGGMRATAWTNVFQGALFLVFMAAALVLVPRSLGGFRAAMAATERADPALLVRGDGWLFEPRKWASWGLTISLAVIAFPHMLVRLMAARDERALRNVARLYPLALALIWLPAVLLGLWAAGAMPGLAAGEVDGVFQRMVNAHLPAGFAAFGLLAVLSAVMSTLDAQLLTLSSMLVRDVLDPRRQAARQRREVWIARGFTLGVAALVYLLAEVWSDASVFDVSRKAFEGYTTLVPTLFLGVRWRRFTVAGAMASILAGNAVLLLGWSGNLPAAGFLPVFWAFLAAWAAGIGLSLATPRQDAEAERLAFGDGGRG
jgi:SSS family solute:Na+ symporter